MANSIIRLAAESIDTQIDALQKMKNRLDDNFIKAIDVIFACKGRVVVTGMGKSGIIGRKIAATLASTGTPSFFVHPAEAFHGDLGMIHPDDAVIMISYSGETEEVIRLLPFIEHQQNQIIAISGVKCSTLTRRAGVSLDISVDREVCRNNLAPTSSTTATVVMGDAIAAVLTLLREFKPEDFARFHPGGSLGKRILTRVCDLMHKDDLPFSCVEDGFIEVVHAITRGRLGLSMIMDGDELAGIITDGDLRRTVESQPDFLQLKAKDFMTLNPIKISQKLRFSEAEKKMYNNKVNSLIVVNDETGKVCGVLQIYDISTINVKR